MAHVEVPAANTLIRTSTFGIPVATELNNRCVKVNGEIGEGVASGVNQWMTGTLVINAAPALRFRRTGDTPYVQWENTTGSVPFATIQASSTLVIYNAAPAASEHSFRVANVEKFNVSATGATATTLTATTKVTIGGNTEQLRLVDTSTAGSDFHDVFIGLYGAGTSLVSPGVRTALIGFAGSSTLFLRNEIVGGDAIVSVAGAGNVSLTATTGTVGLSTTTGNINLITSGAGGDIVLDTGGGGDVSLVSGDAINLYTDGAVRGVMNATIFTWGKTTAAIATPGVEQYGGGAASGTIRSTVGATGAVVGTENLVLNRVATANVTNGKFIDFLRAGTSTAGILMRATAGVIIDQAVVNAPSDYRWKDDLGPVTGALDRVMMLRPRHVRWKGNGVEADEFMAHEVQAVFPELVKGTKDAVTSSGAVDGQSLNTAGLLPDVVAALQELAVRVEGLEAN